MNTDERNNLRNDIIAHFKSQQPAPEQTLVPANAPANLTNDQRQTAQDHWVDYLLNQRNPTSWSAEEKAAVAQASRRALKALGY